MKYVGTYIETMKAFRCWLTSLANVKKRMDGSWSGLVHTSLVQEHILTERSLAHHRDSIYIFIIMLNWQILNSKINIGYPFLYGLWWTLMLCGIKLWHVLIITRERCKLQVIGVGQCVVPAVIVSASHVWI